MSCGREDEGAGLGLGLGGKDGRAVGRMVLGMHAGFSCFVHLFDLVGCAWTMQRDDATVLVALPEFPV